MFKVKTNKEIGEYLKYLISQKYPSDRNFCKEYLKLSNAQINDDEIRKMANRVSQITKGFKAIQTYDLPIFTELLDVTCEQILSAGEYCVPKSRRTTNYSIAFSQNKAEWEEYIHRKDRLILNPDEYDKTVIDYAIEARNYHFIKYLIDKKYIWFINDENSNYRTFGAGTNIQHRENGFQNILQYRLNSEDNLRMEIIALAVENNDFETLELLKAREIPMLRNIVQYLNWRETDYENVYDASRLVKCIANASDEIIEYFTTPFEVVAPNHQNDSETRSFTFVFPFYSELLAELIKKNHRYTAFVLRKAIDYNKKTYEQLKAQAEIFVNDEYTYKPILDLNFYKKLHIICFDDYRNRNSTKTNIICVSQKSNSPILDSLIDDVNSWYEKAIHIQNEYPILEEK